MGLCPSSAFAFLNHLKQLSEVSTAQQSGLIHSDLYFAMQRIKSVKTFHKVLFSAGVEEQNPSRPCVVFSCLSSPLRPAVVGACQGAGPPLKQTDGKKEDFIINFPAPCV